MTPARLWRTQLAWLSAVAPFVACGDGAPAADPCLADAWDDEFHTDCLSAKRLAQRTSTDMVVAQQDLDWYLDVYRRGYEPLRADLGAPPMASSWWPELTATTRASRFTEPWVRGDTATGDAVVDDVLARAHIDVVTALGMMPGPYFGLTSSTHVVVNRNVAAALQGVPDLVVTAATAQPPEGVGATEAFIESARDAAEVDIVYRLGWGDCFVECFGQVSWRVRVTATSATLLSTWVWGEPPPPEILEFWRRGHPNR